LDQILINESGNVIFDSVFLSKALSPISSKFDGKLTSTKFLFEKTLFPILVIDFHQMLFGKLIAVLDQIY
jgi:hypothetical protein